MVDFPWFQLFHVPKDVDDALLHSPNRLKHPHEQYDDGVWNSNLESGAETRLRPFDVVVSDVTGGSNDGNEFKHGNGIFQVCFSKVSGDVVGVDAALLLLFVLVLLLVLLLDAMVDVWCL